MDNLQTAPLTQCLVHSGLTIGTGNTVSTAKAIDYAIRSKSYTRAALANQALPTVDAGSGNPFTPIRPGEGTVIVLGLDASGNLRAMQGSTASTDASGAFSLAPQFPVVPDWIAPIGYLMVRTGPGFTGSWTFGTSNLSAVPGLTVQPSSIVHMPDRPQFN